MSKEYKPFHFKQFSVAHANSAMKVGTDSVLLGCLAVAENAQNALDIGTGSGLLALMMAQQSNAHISAVEIDENACKDADANFKNSPWANRISLHHQTIQSFCEQNQFQKFDWILANPPYFPEAQNFQISDSIRKLARQTTTLSFSDLIASIAFLLHDEGMAGLVLPNSIAQECQPIFELYNLHLHQTISIRPYQHSEVNRIVICLKKKSGDCLNKDFIIYQTNKQYTTAYFELTKAFYLWPDRT